MCSRLHQRSQAAQNFFFGEKNFQAEKSLVRPKPSAWIERFFAKNDAGQGQPEKSGSNGKIRGSTLRTLRKFAAICNFLQFGSCCFLA